MKRLKALLGDDSSFYIGLKSIVRNPFIFQIRLDLLLQGVSTLKRRRIKHNTNFNQCDCKIKDGKLIVNYTLVNYPSLLEQVKAPIEHWSRLMGFDEEETVFMYKLTRCRLIEMIELFNHTGAYPQSDICAYCNSTYELVKRVNGLCPTDIPDTPDIVELMGVDTSYNVFHSPGILSDNSTVCIKLDLLCKSTSTVQVYPYEVLHPSISCSDMVLTLTAKGFTDIDWCKLAKQVLIFAVCAGFSEEQAVLISLLAYYRLYEISVVYKEPACYETAAVAIGAHNSSDLIILVNNYKNRLGIYPEAVLYDEDVREFMESHQIFTAQEMIHELARITRVMGTHSVCQTVDLIKDGTLTAVEGLFDE